MRRHKRLLAYILAILIVFTGNPAYAADLSVPSSASVDDSGGNGSSEPISLSTPSAIALDGSEGDDLPELQTRTFSYTIKYRAVYADGTPAAGIDLKDGVTNDDGFISGVDVFSITLKDLLPQEDGSLANCSMSSSGHYYTDLSLDYELSPDEKSSVIHFACNGNEYEIKAEWNLDGTVIPIDKDGKLTTNGLSVTPVNLSGSSLGGEIPDIDKIDDLTYVCTINLGAKIVETTMPVTLKVHYYYYPYANPYDYPSYPDAEPDPSRNYYELVTDETYSYDVPIKKAVSSVGEYIIEEPDRIEFIDYDCSSGMKAVADYAGVNADDLIIYPMDNYDLRPAKYPINESFDIANKTLTVTQVNPNPDIDEYWFTDGYALDVYLHFRVKAKATITVHHKDEKGNVLRPDTVYQFTDNEYKKIYYLEDIPGYAPTRGDLKIYDANTGANVTGKASGIYYSISSDCRDIWNASYFSSSIEIKSVYTSFENYGDFLCTGFSAYLFRSGDYELTAVYKRLPTINVYNVIDGIENTVLIGSVPVNAIYEDYNISVGDYEAVSLLKNDDDDSTEYTICIPLLADADKGLFDCADRLEKYKFNFDFDDGETDFSDAYYEEKLKDISSTSTHVNTNDINIYLYYKSRSAANKCKITVLDEYLSVDGVVQETNTRLTDTKTKGEKYSYSALTKEGYVVTSDETYSGVVDSDMTIKFVYQEDSSRFVTVKGYITYADGTPIANKHIEIHSTPRYAVTNEKGYYEVENVSVGEHKFKILADDLNTPLVMCDLSVTKPDEDTIKLTFKTDDCVVETDASKANILEIDAILPIYKIAVIDEYYTDGVLERSETRVNKTVKSGDFYSFDALSPDGYAVSSVRRYEGVAVSDLKLVFKYDKKSTAPSTPAPSTPAPSTPTPSTPTPVYYNIKVIDNYYSASMALLKSEVRLSDTAVAYASYEYKALNPEGFTVAGKTSYSGVVTKDLVLIFNYKEAAANKYKLKVVDNYYDADGKLEKSVVREEKIVDEGASYNYAAFTFENYDVVGAVRHNGQIVSDTVLEFKYQAVKVTDEPDKPDEPDESDKPDESNEPDEPNKPDESDEPDEPNVPSKPNKTNKSEKQDEPDASDRSDNLTPESAEYTVTIIDRYIVGVKNLYSDSVFGGLADNSNLTIKKVDGSDDYIVTVERVVRCKDVYKEGSDYSYKAEAPLGFTVVSEASYSGVVTKDIALEFIYAKGFDDIDDIPDEFLDSDATPTVPFDESVDEPKTGDDSVPVMPYIFFMAAVMVAYGNRRRV